MTSEQRSLFCPSKTFLIGEYAVLYGGPALILATGPDFELQIKHTAPSLPCTHNFPKGSPAEKLICNNVEQFQGLALQFVDPHGGEGGFGASTGQFLLVHSIHSPITSHEDCLRLLDLYLQYAWSGKGTPPSGADLLAQCGHGICLYDPQTKRSEFKAWPFDTMAYSLVRTGDKVDTHTHLEQLDRLDGRVLCQLSEEAIAAFQEKKADAFAQRIEAYYAELKRLGLVTSTAQGMHDTLIKKPDVLAVKGCGAMGADVVLVLARSSSVRGSD